jgi:hypothetical protein
LSEEAPIAQPRQHEPLDNLHRHFRLGLVTRLSDPRRQHGEAVMGGELRIAAIDAGLVARRFGDASLEVVADHRLRHATDGAKRIDMHADPVGQSLAPAPFRVGEVGGAERSNKDVRRSCVAVQRIDHRNRVTGEIHEQLLARHVRLAHRRRHAAAPRAVEIAEPTIAVAVRMFRAILLPQQHQRHAAPLELLMQLGPSGSRALRFDLARGREQPALKLAVIEHLRQRPGEADHLGAAHNLASRRLADPKRLADLSVAQ